MTKVFLREKKLKDGKKSLYLDFYPPIINSETRKPTRREHLRLQIYERPKNETEKKHNKETKALGEAVRAERQLDLQANNFGFLTTRNKNKSFIKFFEDFAETKKQMTSKSNYESYKSILKHLKEFTGEEFSLGDVNEFFCIDFRDYLLGQEKISNNTASAYFDKFKYVVGEAYRQKLISDNPAENLKSIKLEDTMREFLTLDELKQLSKTLFEYEDLRRASLFSCMTGLRFCDIRKLTWDEIQNSNENGYYIRFRQKKTKDNETLPISEEAFSLLPEREPNSEKVFKDLQYWQCKYLPIWTKLAGIERKITFHCFRHTFATVQITLGTDIYTLSKMLGHKDLKTTQIYAKIIDKLKREAANRISLK